MVSPSHTYVNGCFPPKFSRDPPPSPIDRYHHFDTSNSGSRIPKRGITNGRATENRAAKRTPSSVGVTTAASVAARLRLDNNGRYSAFHQTPSRRDKRSKFSLGGFYATTAASTLNKESSRPSSFSMRTSSLMERGASTVIRNAMTPLRSFARLRQQSRLVGIGVTSAAGGGGAGWRNWQSQEPSPLDNRPKKKSMVRKNAGFVWGVRKKRSYSIRWIFKPRRMPWSKVQTRMMPVSS